MALVRHSETLTHPVLARRDLGGSAPVRRGDPSLRVAIVHYWLVGMRGGERVLERLIRLYPQADIFTHVYEPKNVSDIIRSRPVRTTFIQKLPGAVKRYKSYLPLMPLALEGLDLTGYDLVICSEAGPAKGVLTHPDAKQICYVHSPMRYIWDQYFAYRETAKPLARLVMPLACHGLRQWDTSSAMRVDSFVSNSSYIQRRVAKSYGRTSCVVHPPVEASLFRRRPAAEIENRWLWVGQMTPYKRADLAVEAFNRLGLPLLMVGEGEMLEKVRRSAGPNITILPRMKFEDLRDAYARCRALVFTPEEDFGIVPVEVMASGRPVLAFGRGGALETVQSGVSGLFFPEQTVDSLIEGVLRMEAWVGGFDPAACAASAARFAPEHFDAGFLNAVEAPQDRFVEDVAPQRYVA